jgi:SAM-dependent methyltransferase
VKEARTFAGFVDQWDGRSMSGWAVDRTRPEAACEVDVYVDGRFVARTRADVPRPDLAEVSPRDQRKGFLLELPPEARNGSRFEVYFGGTMERVPATTALETRFSRPRIDLLQPHGGVASRWVPVPPLQMITHISGETGESAHLHENYRTTGFHVAADIYNTALDLGADPHQRDYSIVDLGCGCGRIATYLAQWLESSKFLGVDIWRAGIDWATDHITATYGNYRFHCSVPGQKGYESSEHHQVPVDAAKTDYVISTSLFTHLDVGACDGYLREIGRILKPGALAYLTFFFRDEQSVAAAEQIARRLNLPMTKEPDAWFYGRKGYIDIFHDRERVTAVATRAGLLPVLHRDGHWRGPARSSTNPMAFQDLLVFQKT